MPRVFISHSSQDREAVERDIISQLEARGVDTWYSKDDIRTASEWERQIRQGLRECDWFLVALSPRSVASEWVRHETHWAFLKRKDKIVPVMLEECDPEDLHLGLLPLQFVDFRGDAAQGLERLLAVWGLDTAGQVERRHQAARDAIAEEDWAAAAERLQDVLRLIPTHEQALADLEHVRHQMELASLYEAGIAHLREGRWGEAFEAFERLRGAGGPYKDVDELMASAAAGRDNVEAERLCRGASDSAAWEEWAKAAEQYQEALRLNPSHAEAQAGLSHALRQRELTESYAAGLEHLHAKRWREALKSFRRVRSVDRHYKGVSDLIADADAGLAEEEEEEARRAITETREGGAGEEAERQAQLAQRRAEAEARAGDVEGPALDMAGAGSAQGAEATGRTNRRLTNKALAILMGGILLLTLALLLWSWSHPRPGYDRIKAETLFAQGKYAEAEAEYRKAIEQNPYYDAENHINLGRALDKQKEYAEAEAEYRKAVALSPDNALYHHYLGIALSNQQKSAEAEAEYRKSLELNPQDPECHHNLGLALAVQQKYAQAEFEFRQAIRLDPDKADYHYNLAKALEKQKRHREAGAEYDKAVELYNRPR